MNAPAQTTRPTTVPDTAGFAPLALRVPSREMRIWIKAWQDEDKDLVDQSYVYLVVTEGQWRVAHVQQQERNAFARLSPPQPTGRPDSAPSAQPGQPVPASSASPAPRAEPEDPSGK